MGESRKVAYPETTTDHHTYLAQKLHNFSFKEGVAREISWSHKEMQLNATQHCQNTTRIQNR